MSDSAPNPVSLVAIQELLMHMQHDLEQLHEVVLRQQRELDGLRGSTSRMNDQLDRLMHAGEERTIEDEKPPHY